MADSFERELDFGRAIIKRAGDAALRYWRNGVLADAKSDASPVTVADRECEKFIAAAVEKDFMEDGLLGEEGSAKEGRSGRRWIIDPIDGTRDFVRGSPVWANFLALEDRGEVVLGVVNLPALGEMFFAAAGSGAWVNESRMRASSTTDVSQAVLLFEAMNEARRYEWAPRLLEFASRFWAVRCLGGCYDSMMVARGMADLWIETSGKPWDFAPIKIIAEEAGARFFDFQGRSTIHGGNAVVCAPGLEAAAREFVGAPAA